ncbi:unnamed protein product [Rotaria sordida]|uniref:Protein kinase domain-containing protein n=1 Tax=Rotaria sordida TaxID=392033 RepID=A0A819DPF0_9BILA|nr:unnamed protein product [Rotaria sordida]CAF3839186.1 unnamed protein product [Rotaria sordida]
MELKSTSSCQTPLMMNSKILTSSHIEQLDTWWCPSITDIEPYVHVILSNLTYITSIELKSKIFSNIDYRLEYTRENLIDQYTTWRSYRLLNNKQEKILFDPPIIAKHVRLNMKQIKKKLCIHFELFGCIFTDGVVSYSMLQGSNKLEDDTYDGQYDEKQRYLYDGLGQLSDGQTGPDNHEDARGLQWVGWRKPRSIKTNHSITILFNFDTLRNFSRMTIHANNYYPKNIYIFRSVTIEFLNNNNELINNSSLIIYHNQHDDQFEMARAIMIDLKNYIASKLKIRLYFDGNTILISEITFDSFIVPILTLTKTKTTKTTTIKTIQQQSLQKETYNFTIYIIVCLSTMAIILILAAIIILIRRTLNNHKKIKKHYFTPIHNHTNSSTSTTSSDIDFHSNQHRYATISSTHPYLLCTNGSINSNTSPHYAKLIPTTTLLRTPSLIQQNHIESICGNSAFSTQRLFTFDMNQNQFIPMHQINIKRKLEPRKQIVGGGEICQGELQINQSIVPITIRRLLPNASVQSKISFFNEISLLTSLCHPNIIHAYGFCSEPTVSLLTESLDLTSIDLYQYLQHYKQEQQMNDSLYATTIFFGSQIASALTYLESLHIYHRDIAARNCLVTLDLTLKLYDLAMSNEIYTDDYVLVTVGNDIETRRPIRWCAWETICLNRFTSKSDVFSFGILLWEILTMAERPHSLLDDNQVLCNLRNSNHYLLIPSCGLDLIDLISSCWHKCDYDRPSFCQINHILCQKQQQLMTKNIDNYQQTN